MAHNLDDHDLAELAREMAMGIKKQADILKSFRLTSKDYARIEQNDFYKRAFQASLIDWTRPLSTERRVTLKAQVLLEDGLLTVGKRMADNDESLASAVEAGKFLAKISGIGEQRDAPANTDRFVITINMGADKVEHYDKPLTPIESKQQELTLVPSKS